MTYQQPPQDPYEQQPQNPYPQPPQPPAYPMPYGPPPPYGYVQPVVVAHVPTSGTAVAAMVLGIVGALGGWCMLGIPCLVAVLLGHVALTETKDGQRRGRGMAVTGLILGYPFAAAWISLFFFGGLGALIDGSPLDSSP